MEFFQEYYVNGLNAGCWWICCTPVRRKTCAMRWRDAKMGRLAEADGPEGGGEIKDYSRIMVMDAVYRIGDVVYLTPKRAGWHGI